MTMCGTKCRDGPSPLDGHKVYAMLPKDGRAAIPVALGLFSIPQIIWAYRVGISGRLGAVQGAPERHRLLTTGKQSRVVASTPRSRQSRGTDSSEKSRIHVRGRMCERSAGQRRGSRFVEEEKRSEVERMGEREIGRRWEGTGLAPTRCCCCYYC